MAVTDRNIVITPNRTAVGSVQPKIVFTGADSDIGDSSAITLFANPENSGTLSFSGTAGQLFSITNNLTGTIFSVNDISGIPSLSINDQGIIQLAEFNGRVIIGDSVGSDDSVSALQVSGALTADSATIRGNVELVSTDAGASAGPTLSLYRNSATPANNDDVGQIQFFAENDADEKVEYARIDVTNSGVTDGGEYGQMDFMVLHNGGETTPFRLSFNLVQIYKDLYIGVGSKIQFEGNAYNDFETDLNVVAPTQDNTILLPDASGTVLTTGNAWS